MMKHTNEMERAEVAGVSFVDCFRKSNLRRTEIVSSHNFCQAPKPLTWPGSLCLGHSILLRSADDQLHHQFVGESCFTHFRELTISLSNAGLSEENSFTINLVMTTMFIIGTLCSWICQYRLCV